MDSKFPASITDLKKSQVNYNHYNVFHILERKRLLHLKSVELNGAEGSSKNEDAPDKSSCELDKSTLAYKLYHTLNLPQLPPRYRDLNLPSHWFIDVVHNQKKRRAHRKSHGLIPFKELARLIADNHKSADYETRAWCQDVASKITNHNHAIQEDFMRDHAKANASPEDGTPREVTQESSRPVLAAHMNSTLPTLPHSSRRHSATDMDEQQTLQAHKMALERERLKHLDLASMMIADRERSMASAFNPVARMPTGFNNMGMFGQSIHHPMSAPISRPTFTSAWDMQTPRTMLPFGSVPGQAGRRTLTSQYARSVAANANREEADPDVSMQDCDKKPAAKSDDDIDLTSDSSTKKPSSRFITILREMVNDTKTNDIVYWLPCGTIFNIADKKAFTKQLIPKFEDDVTGTTNNEKFKSFKACLKQLNFERVASTPEHNCSFKKEGFAKNQASRQNAAANQQTAAQNNSAAMRNDSPSSLRQLQMFAANQRANAQSGMMRNDSSASLRQLEMLANHRGQMISHQQSLYPHRASLPGLGQGHHDAGNDLLMLGYYHGLRAASAARQPVPYPMGSRRLSMPAYSDEARSYAASEVGLSLNQVVDAWKNLERKEEEEQKED